MTLYSPNKLRKTSPALKTCSKYYVGVHKKLDIGYFLLEHIWHISFNKCAGRAAICAPMLSHNWLQNMNEIAEEKIYYYRQNFNTVYI